LYEKITKIITVFKLIKKLSVPNFLIKGTESCLSVVPPWLHPMHIFYSLCLEATQ